MNPIIYSSNQCPYCVRSMSALIYAKIKMEIRGVDITHLPEEAAGGTVPLIDFSNNTPLNESWDIIKWALEENDPDNWLGENQQYLTQTEMLIETNDHTFAPDLKKYRTSEHPENFREDCEKYIQELEDMLTKHQFLLADQITIADISVASFVRLFSLKEPQWFAASPYVKTRDWLKIMLDTPYYKSALSDHGIWHKQDPIHYL